MANENKNIQELVSDDDPTAELEVIQLKANSDGDRESEMTTYDVTQERFARKQGKQSIAVLRSDLKSRQKTISQLQFDIEQLHARQLGLEAEVTARESLTGKLQREAADFRDAMERKEKLLKKRDYSITALKTEIRQREAEHRDLLAEIEKLKIQVRSNESVKNAMPNQRDRTSEVNRSISDRDWRLQLERKDEYADTLRYQLKENVNALQNTASERDKLAISAAELQASLDATSESAQAASKRADETQAVNEKLQAQHQEEIRVLRFELGGAQETVADTEQAKQRLSSDLSELHGQKDNLEKSLSDTQERTKAHIESLQSELQSTQVERDDLASSIAQLQTSLDATNEAANTASKHANESQAASEKLKQQHEEEIRTLQKELGGAREAITDAQGVEHRLSAELTEVKEQRDKLEQLQSDTEKQSKAQIKSLEVELQSAQVDRDDLASSVADLKTVVIDKNSAANAASERADGIQATNELLEKRHQEEIRILRFELGDAQETVADAEEIRDSLNANLTAALEQQERLEQLLADAEERSKAQIGSLETDVSRLSEENHALEEKLHSKQEAISVLLTEIAKNSETDESDENSDESRRVSIKPDDAAVEPAPAKRDEVFERKVAPGERVTRVLVGSIDGQLLRFPLFKSKLTIGRADTNDIQLKAAHISREHAVLQTERNKTRVIDWGSKNGVSVNAERVTEHFLSHGDILTIGNAHFRFEERRIPNT